MQAKECAYAEDMAGLATECEACLPTFIAMGEENRQRIVMVLLQNYGGMRVGELARQTSLSRPAVSHHLKILKDAGIVTYFKRGTMNFYHMNANREVWDRFSALASHVQEIVAGAAEFCEAEEQ